MAIIELTAKEGKYLTQSFITDEANRIFVRKIAGENIDALNWRDATESERNEWQEQYNLEE